MCWVFWDMGDEASWMMGWDLSIGYLRLHDLWEMNDGTIRSADLGLPFPLCVCHCIAFRSLLVFDYSEDLTCRVGYDVG